MRLLNRNFNRGHLQQCVGYYGWGVDYIFMLGSRAGAFGAGFFMSMPAMGSVPWYKAYSLSSK